jgi:glycosyltransferase involved in cell wall biosynthesis
VANSVPRAEIYNLHWINDFVDPLPFFRTVQQPVVWTLHDMNPFTGGCHYNVGCRRFEDCCGSCPQLGSSEETDLSRAVWKRKNRAYNEHVTEGGLEVVADSHWLAEEARSSALFSDIPVHVIHYGLDHHIFRDRDTDGLRKALEIPADHRIVLFVAQSAQNHRKGFDLLAEAISALQTEKTILLSIGGEKPILETELRHAHFGTIESDVLLSVFYSVADIFVIPSRQEAFGQTALEAMACGTPVVGFDTGGIPDMVRPDETGWLVEVGNVRALRGQIEHALRDKEKRERLGRNCREIVEEEYTLERQATQYQRLYEDLLHRQERSNGR